MHFFYYIYLRLSISILDYYKPRKHDYPLPDKAVQTKIHHSLVFILSLHAKHIHLYDHNQIRQL